MKMYIQLNQNIENKIFLLLGKGYKFNQSKVVFTLFQVLFVCLFLKTIFQIMENCNAMLLTCLEKTENKKEPLRGTCGRLC